MLSEVRISTSGFLVNSITENLRSFSGIVKESKLLDEFKKWRFYKDGRSFPQKRLEEELGDILYYVFAVCNELGVKPEDIMWQNRNKLRERYAITSKLPPNCT